MLMTFTRRVWRGSSMVRRWCFCLCSWFSWCSLVTRWNNINQGIHFCLGRLLFSCRCSIVALELNCCWFLKHSRYFAYKLQWCAYFVFLLAYYECVLYLIRVLNSGSNKIGSIFGLYHFIKQFAYQVSSN